MDKSEYLKNDSGDSYFLRFRCFFFLLRCSLFDLLYILSSDKSYSINDYSYDDGSEFRSSRKYFFCAFSLRFGDSVGVVSGLGSGFFVPTGVNYKCDFSFVVFIAVVVESKGGQLILALKFCTFFPNLRQSFIVIVVV